MMIGWWLAFYNLLPPKSRSFLISICYKTQPDRLHAGYANVRHLRAE